MIWFFIGLATGFFAGVVLLGAVLAFSDRNGD